MDSSGLAAWFREYLDAFAACGRGEQETSTILTYVGVPLILTTDAGAATLATDDEVMGWAQQQVDGMLAADYHHSEVLEASVTVLNATSGFYRASYARVRRDGSEISRVAVTYLAVAGSVGTRITGLFVHAPE